MDIFDDDQMHGLRATLLATGRGRRPSLPSLTLDNKLLYQLHLLQQEGNHTRKDLEKWFGKLFPDAAYPADRVSRLIGRVAEKVTSLTGDEQALFLSQRVDFNFISEALQAIGVDRRMDYSTFIKCQLTNQHVMDLQAFFTKEQLGRDYFLETLTALSAAPLECTTSELTRRMLNITKAYKSLSGKKNKDNLLAWLKEPFTIKSSELPSTFTPQLTSTPIQSPIPGPSIEASVNSDIKKSSQSTRILQQQLADAIENAKVLQLKLDTVTCLYEKECALKHSQEQALSEAIAERDRLYSSNLSLEDELRSIKASKLYKSNWKLKKQVRSLVDVKEANKDLTAKVEKLTRQVRLLQKNLSRAKRTQRSLKEAKEKLDMEAVQQICDESSNIHVPLREGNRYTDDIRKTVIALQSTCNVSASQCSKVIQAVALHLFHTEWSLSELPSEQTLRDIADEAHVLSKVLTVEKLREATKFTLHVDGTSRYQRKFLGYQVTLDDGCTLNLGLVDVATEDSATLLDVTIAVLQELGDVYDSSQQDQIFREILQKLHSTMTDRASVMKKFSKDLNTYRMETLQSSDEIAFLHCNAHFLLGLSSSCDAALKDFEHALKTEIGGRLGRDKSAKFARFSSSETASSRIIRTACAILGPRGDQKSGCRMEWLGFCEENDVTSKLPSYRSNRFNCFFEASARLVQLQETIKLFLNGGYLGHNNLLIDSVREDINDTNLMAIITSIGLLFVHFTGPYWLLLQSNTFFCNFAHHVQCMLQDFMMLSREPHTVLDSNFCTSLSQAFPIDVQLKESLYTSLQASTKTTVITSAFQKMMLACIDVAQRQLCDFLECGKFANITSDVSFKHCPLTNLIGENAFGDFDFSLAKHRHASLFHHSTLSMSKHNRVSAWLCTKSTEVSSKLMAEARKGARHLRQKHRQREHQVMAAVRRKMLENAAAQHEKEAKAAESKQKLIQAVMNHGGPCLSAADVTVLQRSLDAREFSQAIKDEIRYQKVILGMPGVLKLTKPVPELCQMLKDHLSTHSHVTDMESGEESDREEGMQAGTDHFKFDRPGTWVAVFYDNQFYVGQVVVVCSETAAEVKFLEQTKARDSYFRWPRTDDIAIVESQFVFSENFEVRPVSSDCRIWEVDNINDLKRTYERIRRQN